MSSNVGVSGSIQCVGFLKRLCRVLQVVEYVGTVRVISDLTRRLQVHEMMTHAAASYRQFSYTEQCGRAVDRGGHVLLE